ncbi:MATE family efflux transporter [Tuanshanicoccus lijuaniae]|uniref:MATE family efflux transporter n=1 Tax=Aerococcaceae bacterium zg-1292 TaxID=2774330 RepID=UPI001936E925|nr:MATE family efflux transporter [Aerococcaceae bacterium zg-1292]MBF6625866.1 MATE family efflux transporter [Aerococcaceae bacterium zg-BR9]MBF6978578.1 MATE family efflux transporter [Aerococcaceae bacterium zg-BR22]MBS4455558.1 MATE family efflux transporter [Aerococcaceae bacterium zg-A91]MBS4457177.1 MATE family efflux transporter [Aerococcaceae bacterium zg-BR33]
MRQKHYYKTALQMAWPSVLESFFISLAGMIDTMMVGSLGSYAIASVGLTTQPKLIGLTLFFGITISVSTIVARRRGQEDKRGANEVFLTAMILALIGCVIITTIALYFAHPILTLSGSNQETHQAAVNYFQIIMGGLIFNVIAMVINAAQRGSGNTKIAFVTNLTSSIINIVFNYLLIGGQFGFPALGIQGAALATVIGSMVAMLMSIRSLFKRQSLIQIPYILHHKVKMRFETVKTIFKIGSTMVIENLAMRIGFVTTAITAANLGTHSFAIYNAGMNLLSLGFSFGDGMQVAAVALSGRALGKGDHEEAINFGYICQRIGLAMSILLSIFLFLFGQRIMGLYFDNPSVVVEATKATRFIMIIVLLQISQLVYGGCLRAGGDVRYTLMTGIISVSIIRTTVTLVLVHIFNLGLNGIWIGILTDQLSRFTLLRHRFKLGKWTQIQL